VYQNYVIHRTTTDIFTVFPCDATLAYCNLISPLGLVLVLISSLLSCRESCAQSFAQLLFTAAGGAGLWLYRTNFDKFDFTLSSTVAWLVGFTLAIFLYLQSLHLTKSATKFTVIFAQAIVSFLSFAGLTFITPVIQHTVIKEPWEALLDINLIWKLIILVVIVDVWVASLIILIKEKGITAGSFLFVSLFFIKGDFESIIGEDDWSRKKVFSVVLVVIFLICQMSR